MLTTQTQDFMGPSLFYLIYYYNDLSTRTKLVVASAAVVCSAGFALWYYRREDEDKKKNEQTDEVLEASEEVTSRQLQVALQEKKSTTAVSEVKDLSGVLIPPQNSNKVEMIRLLTQNQEVFSSTLKTYIFLCIIFPRSH